MGLEFENFIKKFPADLLQFFKSLRTKFRFNLTTLLLDEGSFSLSEIAKKNNVKSGYLVSQLKILELSGIIQNYIEKKDYTAQYSFYEITDYGAKILKEILKYRKFLNFERKLILKDDKSRKNQLYNELESFLKALSNKFRINLLLYLFEKDSISFSQIVEITKKEKSSVTNHLKKLELCGLIQNFLKRSEKTSDYSFYKITKLGIESINGLISSYNSYFQLDQNIRMKDELHPSIY